MNRHEDFCSGGDCGICNPEEFNRKRDQRRKEAIESTKHLSDEQLAYATNYRRKGQAVARIKYLKNEVASLEKKLEELKAEIQKWEEVVEICEIPEN